MVLGNKLRLAVAALSDVGRRREHNQDYTTHQIPSDEQLLTDKGALFIICDGMGGYAAGEIASEIAATTIQDVYYKSEESNVISRIAEAIKQANLAVYNHAHEHPETAGMGTTAVVLIVHDGRAYYVNVGDSRGYLMREGHLRQVTQDHSWVAEQVRAGVLTDEQAINHPHRNVITRSLGTQPTINADLFIETLRDGDRVLLCCDGLHGYVAQADIEREVHSATDLDLGAQKLIDMANANGGPDNITALLVDLLEVPEPVRELEIPGGPPEEQIVTQPLPAVKRPRAQGRKSSPLAASGAKRSTAVAKSSGGRGARTALALVAVLVLAVLGTGAWYIGIGPYASARAATAQLDADTAHAKQVAQQSSSQDPAAALAALADARQRVLADIANPQANPSSVQSAQAVLDGPLATAVQTAVQHYNQVALITPLSLSSVYTYTVDCTGTAANSTVPLVTLTALATVTSNVAATGTQVLYALANGALYQIGVPVDTTTQQPNGGPVVCVALSLSGVSGVVALASDGATLYMLAQQSNGGFEVLGIGPTGTVAANGLPVTKIVQHFAVAAHNGETPVALAASAGAIYVGYKPGASGTPGIWVYRGNVSQGPAQTLTLPQPANSLAVVNGTVFGLLTDGTLGEFAANNSWQAISVQVQNPLTHDDPTSYVSATPVPTVSPAVTTTATGSTQFDSHDMLLADSALHTHLLVNDGAQSRLIRFIASGTGPGLGLAAQYVYDKPLVNVSPLAVTSNGTTLGVYGWSAGSLVALPIPEPSA
jgi:serine/threonine protein phosphatase PrpC